MKIGVVGLGLIGGSICKALKQYSNHYIIGLDKDEFVLDQAFNEEAIDEVGNEYSLSECDIVFICLYPQAIIDFVKANGTKFKKGTIICDVCGIKSYICSVMPQLAQSFGLTFVGTHPMAGKERNGFSHSEAGLFRNASFIITPCLADSDSISKVEGLATTMQFKEVVFATPQHHDTMISFTSQLPHVLATSYVLSPQCPTHKGFSAGSYRDVSRVARINENLWTELFFDNKEPLLGEVETLIENLTDFKKLLESSDVEGVKNFLKRGRIIKEELGE